MKVFAKRNNSTDFGGKLSFILSFLFPERLHCCYIHFHCSYLYNCYNYFRTLCIPHRDWTKFSYFADTTERGHRGVKAGPKRGWRQSDFTDNSILSWFFQVLVWKLMTKCNEVRRTKRYRKLNYHVQGTYCLGIKWV